MRQTALEAQGSDKQGFEEPRPVAGAESPKACREMLASFGRSRYIHCKKYVPKSIMWCLRSSIMMYLDPLSLLRSSVYLGRYGRS